jgi:hypothetical protein
MKKTFKILIAILFVCCLSGCGCSPIDKINNGSRLVAIRNEMLKNLDNYSYDVKIVTKTGFVDVETSMFCKEDNKNAITYCKTTTYTLETEEYVDKKEEKTYSRIYSKYSNDKSNGVWTSTKYENSKSNSWINLSNYIFDLTEEAKDGGVYFTGTIDSKKLAEALSLMNPEIDTSKIISNDINISVFVNSSNYIEKMQFTIEILGVKEEVEITYHSFNTSGDIIIPAEVK